VPPAETTEAATRALLAGYRHSEAEMEAIEALDAGERIGPDPDVFVRPPAR
jgi:hypothetical protein